MSDRLADDGGSGPSTATFSGTDPARLSRSRTPNTQGIDPRNPQSDPDPVTQAAGAVFPDIGLETTGQADATPPDTEGETQPARFGGFPGLGFHRPFGVPLPSFVNGPASASVPADVVELPPDKAPAPGIQGESPATWPVPPPGLLVSLDRLWSAAAGPTTGQPDADGDAVTTKDAADKPGPLVSGLPANEPGETDGEPAATNDIHGRWLRFGRYLSNGASDGWKEAADLPRKPGESNGRWSVVRGESESSIERSASDGEPPPFQQTDRANGRQPIILDQLPDDRHTADGAGRPPEGLVEAQAPSQPGGVLRRSARGPESTSITSSDRGPDGTGSVEGGTFESAAAGPAGFSAGSLTAFDSGGGSALHRILPQQNEGGAAPQAAGGTIGPTDDGPPATNGDSRSTELTAAGPRGPASRSDVAAGETGRPAETPHFDRVDFAERLAAVLGRARDDGRRLHVRLHPPELGFVQVEVLARDGVLSARLDVQTHAAQQAVREHLGLLREALAQQGNAIDRIDVHVDSRHAGGEHGRGEGTAGHFGGSFHHDFEDQGPDHGYNGGGFTEGHEEGAEPERPPAFAGAGMDRLDIRI